MPLEKSPEQRKRPTQQRAVATAQAIVDAAGRVLVAHGYDGCSTNRIAAEAGVSKGSLYQYFADKDEVLSVLVTQVADTMTARVFAAIDGALGSDWRPLGMAALTATFEAVDDNRAMLRPLIAQAPHLRVMESLMASSVRGVDIGRTYMALNPGQFRAGLDVEATLLVLVGALRSVLTDYIGGTVALPRERLAAALAEVAANALVGAESTA